MRLNLILGGALAALVAAAGAAHAADLPFEEPAPAVVAVPSFSWSGFYVGGAIGYAFSDLDVRNSRLGDNFRYKNDVDGLTGSGFVGFNYEFGSVVAGAEADITFGDFGGNSRGCPNGGYVCKSNADDLFGTIRGRVGFAADRFLIFATGGLAIGGEVDFSRRNTVGLPTNFDFQKKGSGTRYGYTLGAGVDYAVTDHLFVRAEYQYVDFGKESFVARSAIGGTQPVQIDQDLHLIRAGVGYKF